MPTSTLSCILAANTAYSMLNVGLVLEKKGAAELPSIENTSAWGNVRNFLSNRAWLIGFILTNIQMVFLWLALALGPLSLVTPMLGVGLVVLVLLSVFYLKEPITQTMVLGIALTIGGIVAFSALSASPPVMDWAATLTLAHSGNAFMVYGAMVLGALLPVLITRALDYRHADILLGISCGFLTSLGTLFAKLMVAGVDIARPMDSILHDPGRPFLLLFFVLLAGSNCSSMILQQVGFQKGRAIVLAPIFTVGCVLVPAFCGIFLFDEWTGASALTVAARIGSMAVILAGVALLSYGNASGGRPLATAPEAA